ncbi:P63C domain-containing protein [Mesorhizobium sp. KR1-2]|uniref:P63C domain-containing protein n=1 Tax=Mesorhizobium sp. KR1-2 TaxID=3156609 RepID=UPI0032B48768
MLSLDSKGKGMTDKHSKAGKARLTKLTPEQRSEIARAGAVARWERADPSRAALPKAIFGADDRPLRIGEMEIPCYVLDDERRVLTISGMLGAMRMAQGGSMIAGMNRFELFTTRERIKPFVISDLAERIHNPIHFITPSGGRAQGYEAEVLVDLCEAVLAARAAGVLQKQQLSIAQSCEMIIRGLARVGIVALVDEATGYQEVRKRDALYKILEAYIAPELMKWAKRFPDSFYKEMFRLHGWEYDPESVKRPGVVGKFTNTYIYEQLPPGVINELREINPKDEFGRRKNRHHQFLTEHVGNPHLEKQISATTTLMRASDDWPTFKRLFAKAFPRSGDQMELLAD